MDNLGDKCNFKIGVTKKEIDEVTVLRIDRIDKESILDTLKSAYARTIFVVDMDNAFYGIITGGDYVNYFQSKCDIELINKNCVFLRDKLDVCEHASRVFMIREIVLAIPVLNDKKELLYVLGRNPYHSIFEVHQETLYNKLLFDIIKIQKNSTYNLNHYLQDKYKNIAIWGINYLTLALGELIKNNDNLNLVGLFAPTMPDNLNLINTDVVENIFYGYDALSMRQKNIDLIIIGTTTILDCIDLNVVIQNVPHTYVRNLVNTVKYLQSELIVKNMYETFKWHGIQMMRVPIVPLEFDAKFEYNHSTINFGEFENELDRQEFINNKISRPAVEARGELRFHSDYHSKYINCINGERLTFYQPEKYNNTIFLVGNCAADGINAIDENTVGSYLQKMVNDKGLSYRVRAFGVGSGTDDQYVVNRLMTFKYRQGDIVVLFNNMGLNILDEEWEIDMTKPFSALLKIENFFTSNDCCHCNYKGYKLMAEEIFKKLLPISYSSLVAEGKDVFVLDKTNQRRKVFEKNLDIEMYVQKLLKHKVADKYNKIGSIVMNCNPFTKGHRYLVEAALREVEFLYVFVVEEDLSVFSFKDRFDLVKLGLSDLAEICIIPSGKFIISSRTFSSYFQKGSPVDIRVDTSLDVEIFAQYIAPAMNITVRFVGEEPFDYVTRQYNQTLKEVLPDNGIDVVEIARTMVDGEVISASKVRKALEEKDWAKIDKFVPETTFNYLKEKN